MSTRSINNERTQRKYTNGVAGGSGESKAAEEREGVFDRLRAKIDPPEESAESTSQSKESSSYSTSRRSSASARPSREKSAGVTVIPSSSQARYKQTSSRSQADLSKEERKRQRRELRDHDDKVSAVADALAEQDEQYMKMRRLWNRMLIGGFASILVAFIAQMVVRQGVGGEAMVVVAGVFLILSYVLIIGALVYDLWKVNKIRKKYQAQATGMSERRLNTELNEAAQRKAERIAEEGDGLWARIKRFWT